MQPWTFYLGPCTVYRAASTALDLDETARSRFVTLSYVDRIRHLLGKAIHTREMIKNGDHVMVAVSGGLDSLSLLWLLRERLRRIPISYTLTAIHVDLGFGANSGDRMESFFSQHGFDYRIIKTEIGEKAHSPENRESPCFLCSWLRRKVLFQAAADMGCRKIAYGHHKDDVIETFFLNVFYGASISTMTPVQEFFNGEICIIRPLFMIDGDLVKRYGRSMGWPEISSGCPTSGFSKREEIKRMLSELYRGNKKVIGNIFHALHNVTPDYLL
jgi:tRNA 2-thiocytidine biosynthesis protein TtcA